jgi:hypothetical protein
MLGGDRFPKACFPSASFPLQASPWKHRRFTWLPRKFFSKGAAGTDGIFIFKTPPKSAYLFAAAPGFEGEKITY